MKVMVSGNRWRSGAGVSHRPNPSRAVLPFAAPPLVAANVVSAALTAACQPGGAAAPEPLVRDSLGVTIVEAPGELLDHPAPLRVHPEPHLRVGAMDGPPEALFTQPRWAERLSDGRIFVVEIGPVPGRLLHPDGTFDRWVGGMDEGPGELQRGGGGGVLSGDTLWIRDLGNQQFSRFTSDGGFLDRVAYTRPAAAFQPRRAWLLPGGGVLDEGGTLNFGQVMENPGPFQEEILVHHLPEPGDDPRLLLRIPGLRYRSGTMSTSDGSQVPMVGSDGPIFSAAPQVRPVPGGGVWLTVGRPFEARRYDTDGRLLAVVRVPVPGERVTPALEEAYWSRLLDNADPGMRHAIRRRMADAEWPATLPPTGEVLVDHLGRLWLGEFSLHRFRPPEVWWVLEPERGLLGRVELPPGLTLLSVSEGEVLGVEQDEFDAPYLVAHRLEGW